MSFSTIYFFRIIEKCYCIYFLFLQNFFTSDVWKIHSQDLQINIYSFLLFSHFFSIPMICLFSWIFPNVLPKVICYYFHMKIFSIHLLKVYILHTGIHIKNNDSSALVAQKQTNCFILLLFILNKKEKKKRVFWYFFHMNNFFISPYWGLAGKKFCFVNFVRFSFTNGPQKYGIKFFVCILCSQLLVLYCICAYFRRHF